MIFLICHIVAIINMAGQYDGIMVIPPYVDSPILILKLFLLYDFIVIDIIAI